MSLSPTLLEEQQNNNSTPGADDDQLSVGSSQGSPQHKRLCLREETLMPYMDFNNLMRYALPAPMNEIMPPGVFLPHIAPMLVPTLPGYMEALPTGRTNYPYVPNMDYEYICCNEETSSQISSRTHEDQNAELFVDVVSTSSEDSRSSEVLNTTTSSSLLLSTQDPVQRSSFSITAILANNNRNTVSV